MNSRPRNERRGERSNGIQRRMVSGRILAATWLEAALADHRVGGDRRRCHTHTHSTLTLPQSCVVVGRIGKVLDPTDCGKSHRITRYAPVDDFEPIK